MKRQRTIEELLEILDSCKCSPVDGKNRCVSDSEEIAADGEYWAVISDHGNAELGYRGRNGRMYWIGGLV